MTADLKRITRNKNGERQLHIKLPNWISISLVILIFTIIVNTVIFVYSTKTKIGEYDRYWDFQFRFNEGVRSAEREDHKGKEIRPIDADDIVRGGSSNLGIKSIN